MTILLALIGFVFIVAIYLLFRSVMNGAVYFPTQAENIAAMIHLAEAESGTRVIDLGSGDGRICIAFGKRGSEVHGYEINPILVLRSRLAVKRAGLQGNIFIHWRSFWRAPLRYFDVVIIYGIPYIMGRLEKKLRRELKPGAKVVSNIYAFPRWRAAKKEKGTSLYT